MAMSWSGPHGLQYRGASKARLSHSTVPPVLARLAERTTLSTSPEQLRDLAAARRRFLITLPLGRLIKLT